MNENKKKFEDTYGFQVEKPTIEHSKTKPKVKPKNQKHWFFWVITGLVALIVASFMAISIFIVFAIAIVIRFFLPKKATPFAIQKKD